MNSLLAQGRTTTRRRRGSSRQPVWQRRGVLVLLVLAATALVRLADYLGWPGASSPASVPAQISGTPRLIDGDSLRLGSGFEVRLVGIDAPEGRQQCKRAGRGYRCGREATRALERLIAGASLACESEQRDQHGRVLATCWTGQSVGAGVNINEQMVARGWAVAFGRRYRREEAAARNNQRGLWAGRFARPADWRRDHYRR